MLGTIRCFFSAIVWIAWICNSAMPFLFAAGFDTNGGSIFQPQAAGGFDAFANGNGNDTEQEELDKGLTNFQPEVRQVAPCQIINS